MKRISLIVPVYNAGKSLPGMLESVRRQTFRDFEVVFVEDAGTDDSAEQIEAFCKESGLACKFVRQDRNQGAAAARNRALDLAEGEYLAFADADDRLEDRMLETAACVARETGADIIGWDWTLGLEKGGRYMRQADYSTPEEALLALTRGRMRWNLWLFLVRRDLVEKAGISFIPGADMGEDMQFILRCFLKAGTAARVHDALYRYNALSSTSISREFSARRRAQIETNLAALEASFSGSPFAEANPDAISALKLYLKRPLLVSGSAEDLETWQSWFPEVNGLARAGSDDPLHIKLLQMLAARGCRFGVRLYYWLIYKFVYGILYR